MKLDIDGDLTIYIQNDSPEKNKESERLPPPKDAFYLIWTRRSPGPFAIANPVHTQLF
jgi:hypothetical protein